MVYLISTQSIQNFNHAQLSGCGLISISSFMFGGRKRVVGQSYGKCHTKLSFHQAPELPVPPFNQVQPLKTPYTDIFEPISITLSYHTWTKGNDHFSNHSLTHQVNHSAYALVFPIIW